MNGEGRKKTGGRKKGTKNKVTTDVKSMILGALEAKGGVQYLQSQADENPVAFMTLIGKVLPMTVNADVNNNIIVRIVELTGNHDDD